MQVRRCLQHGKACDLPDVTHNPRPFQPALGSSRRPSIRFSEEAHGVWDAHVEPDSAAHIRCRCPKLAQSSAVSRMPPNRRGLCRTLHQRQDAELGQQRRAPLALSSRLGMRWGHRTTSQR